MRVSRMWASRYAPCHIKLACNLADAVTRVFDEVDVTKHSTVSVTTSRVHRRSRVLLQISPQRPPAYLQQRHARWRRTPDCAPILTLHPPNGNAAPDGTPDAGRQQEADSSPLVVHCAEHLQLAGGLLLTLSQHGHVGDGVGLVPANDFRLVAKEPAIRSSAAVHLLSYVQVRTLNGICWRWRRPDMSNRSRQPCTVKFVEKHVLIAQVGIRLLQSKGGSLTVQQHSQLLDLHLQLLDRLTPPPEVRESLTAFHVACWMAAGDTLPKHACSAS